LRFKGGLFGTKSIHCRRIYDLAGAISYSVKPPYHGYSVISRKDATFGHSRCALSLSQHFYLWQHLKELNYSGLTFSSGKGTQILREARQNLS